MAALEQLQKHASGRSSQKETASALDAAQSAAETLAAAAASLVASCTDLPDPLSAANLIVSQFVSDMELALHPKIPEAALNPPQATCDVFVAFAHNLACAGELVSQTQPFMALLKRSGALGARRIHAARIQLAAEYPQQKEISAAKIISMYHFMCNNAEPSASTDSTASELSHLLAAVIRLPDAHEPNSVRFGKATMDALMEMIKKHGSQISTASRLSVALAMLKTSRSPSDLESVFPIAMQMGVHKTPEFQQALFKGVVNIAGFFLHSTARIDACLYWIRKLALHGIALTEATCNLIVFEYAKAGLPHRGIAWAAAKVWPNNFKLHTQTVLMLLKRFRPDHLKDTRSGTEHQAIDVLWRHTYASADPSSQSHNPPASVLVAFAHARASIGDLDGAIADLEKISLDDRHVTQMLDSNQLIDELENIMHTIATDSNAQSEQVAKAWTTIRSIAGQHRHRISLSLLLNDASSQNPETLVLAIQTLLLQSNSDHRLSRQELEYELGNLIQTIRQSHTSRHKKPRTNNAKSIVVDKNQKSCGDLVDKSISILTSIHQSLNQDKDVDDSLDTLDRLFT